MNSSFEPFGGDYSDAQDAGVFLRFPGQWDDESWASSSAQSGYYNVNRWFDWTSGSYSRPDPERLFEPDTQLVYGYGLQRPTVVIDPSGLKIEIVDPELSPFVE